MRRSLGNCARSIFFVTVVVSVTTIAQAPALADEAESALRLLGNALACPTKIVNSGDREGVHSIYKFTGNQRTFSVSENTISYTRSDGRRTVTVQYSAKFADLEAALEPGSGIRIVCHDGTGCIRQVVDERGRHSSQMSARIDFDFCDNDTAVNAVTAIRTLIVNAR